jgi:hypothetical protein
MAEFELFYDMGGEYGDGITLNKHGDRYSLVRAKKSKKAEGTIYLEWCFPQDRDRKPRDKAIPLGVQIGNRTEAVKFFRWALSQLEPNGKQAASPPAQDDIPF